MCVLSGILDKIFLSFMGRGENASLSVDIKSVTTDKCTDITHSAILNTHLYFVGVPNKQVVQWRLCVCRAGGTVQLHHLEIETTL